MRIVDIPKGSLGEVAPGRQKTDSQAWGHGLGKGPTIEYPADVVEGAQGAGSRAGPSRSPRCHHRSGEYPGGRAIRLIPGGLPARSCRRWDWKYSRSTAQHRPQGMLVQSQAQRRQIEPVAPMAGNFDHVQIQRRYNLQGAVPNRRFHREAVTGATHRP